MLKRAAAVMVFLALPCLTSLAGPAAEASQQNDALVLSAVLLSQCQSKDGYVILSSTTVAPRGTDDLGEADESGAFDNLKRRNGSTAPLPEGLSCEGARLHGEQEIQRFFDRDSNSAGKMSFDAAWKKFFESFPGATGWMSVSLPGYAPSQDIAVVYVANHCGSLCGQGSYVYLRRANGRWKVIVRFPIWVS